MPSPSPEPVTTSALQSIRELRIVPAPLAEKPFDVESFEPVALGATIEVMAGVRDPFVKPTWPVEVIKTAKGVEKMVARICNKDVLALDSETSVTTEKREAAEARGEKVRGDLSEQLCWLQFSVANQRRAAVKGEGNILPGVTVDVGKEGINYLISVKALAMEAREKFLATGVEQNPLEPLFKLFHRDPPILFVIQNAPFDLGQLAKFGPIPETVDDTQKLAKWFRRDLLADNLASLCLEILGKPLSKEERESNFDTTDPTEAQLLYMPSDTEELIKLWSVLMGYWISVHAEAGAIVATGDVEKIAYAIREKKQAAEALLQDTGIADKLLELEAEAIAYRTHLDKVLLPALYEQTMEQLGDLFDPKVGYKYKGPFGSAYCRCHRESRLDLEELARRDDTLLKDATELKTSEDRIKEARKDLTAKGRKFPSMASIWKEIRNESLGEPQLVLDLIDLPLERNPARLAELVKLPPDLTVDDCQRRELECRISALKLKREAGIGNELERIARVVEFLEAGLLQTVLAQYNKPERREHKVPLADGSEVGFKKKVVRAVDFPRFHSRYPELYALSVREDVTIGRLEEALKARGFNEKQREQYLKEVKIRTGKLSRPSARSHPSMAVYYRGYKEDQRDKFENDTDASDEETEEA